MNQMGSEIFEVGPRDGLQSETKILSVAERFDLVKALCRAGLKKIEIGSFVRADRIPQLEKTDELFKKLSADQEIQGLGVEFWAFVPNRKGLDAALAAGFKNFSFFSAVSDTFCQKNVGRTSTELLSELQNLLSETRKLKMKSRVYVSTLVHCPYEGKIEIYKLQKFVRRLLGFECDKLVLSDTTGAANPDQIRNILRGLLKFEKPKRFAMHLHDTRGLALANLVVAELMGVREFDSSVGGLGGCPYAPGASGNLATEDLANWLFETHKNRALNMTALRDAGAIAEKLVGHPLPSKALKYLSTQ